MINQDKIQKLIDQVEAGPNTPRERQLVVALKQVTVQHDFAFDSWQRTVKRSGGLSADLEVVTKRTKELEGIIAKLLSERSTKEDVFAQGTNASDIARGPTRPSLGPDVHTARTTINKGATIPPKFDSDRLADEHQRTRIHRHSGGAVIIGNAPALRTRARSAS